jgi:hypothetical protein
VFLFFCFYVGSFVVLFCIHVFVGVTVVAFSPAVIFLFFILVGFGTVAVAAAGAARSAVAAGAVGGV